MFYSSYIMVSLLVTIVQLTSAVQPEECVLANKPSMENLDVLRFVGKWYMRADATTLGIIAGLNAEVMNVTSSRNGQETKLYFSTDVSYSSNQFDCINLGSRNCTLQGSICTYEEFNDVDEIIAIEYDSVMAFWSGLDFDDEMYYSLKLYTRDVFSQPNISSIQSALQGFCGEPATDPTSSFYYFKPTFNNSPCVE